MSAIRMAMSSQMQVSVIDWRTKSFGDIEPPRHREEMTASLARKELQQKIIKIRMNSPCKVKYMIFY